MKLYSRLKRWANTPYDPKRNSLHRDIFAAAMYFAEEGWPKEKSFAVMRAAADKVDERIVPDRELTSAIDCAVEFASGNRSAYVRWPQLQESCMAEAIARNASTAGQVIEEAKRQPSRHRVEILRSIYRDEDIVCIGIDARNFYTERLGKVLEFFKGGGLAEYINPSPMSALSGVTKEGKISQHCEANTGPKVFQVVEFDFGDPRNHVAIHLHLASLLPLMMLVYSGGKSVHGWYRLTTEAEALPFFAEACSLGADPKMWGKSQFSRMPGGLNPKHNRTQKVLYFDERYSRRAS